MLIADADIMLLGAITVVSCVVAAVLIVVPLMILDICVVVAVTLLPVGITLVLKVVDGLAFSKRFLVLRADKPVSDVDKPGLLVLKAVMTAGDVWLLLVDDNRDVVLVVLCVVNGTLCVKLEDTAVDTIGVDGFDCLVVAFCIEVDKIPSVEMVLVVLDAIVVTVVPVVVDKETPPLQAAPKSGQQSLLAEQYSSQ